MTFQLVCIEPKELTQYKSDMQEAFQKGFEDVFGKTDAVIPSYRDAGIEERGEKSRRLGRYAMPQHQERRSPLPDDQGPQGLRRPSDS